MAIANALAETTEKAAVYTVALHAEPHGSSSGVVWRPGVIVTAEHALPRDEDIQVTLADGRVAGATLVGRDATSDLAVLRCVEAQTAIHEWVRRRWIISVVVPPTHRISQRSPPGQPANVRNLQLSPQTVTAQLGAVGREVGIV